MLDCSCFSRVLTSISALTALIVEDCPVKTGKKYYYLRYNKKYARLAQRIHIEETDEFKDRYRWRAIDKCNLSMIQKLDKREILCKEFSARGREKGFFLIWSAPLSFYCILVPDLFYIFYGTWDEN